MSIDFSAGIRFSLSRIIILKIHKNGLYGKIVSLQNIISIEIFSIDDSIEERNFILNEEDL